MHASFIRVNRHWTESLGLSRPAVVLSELPRGDSPVTVRTRSIKYVIEGTERYAIDGRVHVVNAGEFLVVDAGVACHAVLSERGITRGMCLYLPPTAAIGARDPVAGDPAIGRAFQIKGAAVPFGRMLAEAARRLGRQRQLSSSEAGALVTHAAAEFDAFHATLATELMRIDAAKPATRRELLQRVHRARGYLHDHVGAVVPLAELATVAGMSQFHLARSFRAVFGKPPAQYHAELRIALAEQALRTGRMSIAEAAGSFGFAEPSSFSRAFTRVTGRTPGQAVRGGRS